MTTRISAVILCLGLILTTTMLASAQPRRHFPRVVHTIYTPAADFQSSWNVSY